MERVKVLFVDDEANILNSIKRGVFQEDFMSYYALSGKEALAIMERETIAVIVTDMRMPEMNGLELLNIVKEKYPQTVRMVLSGYAQLPQILATVNLVGVFKFITKPWSMEDELITSVKQGIEYYNLYKQTIELKDSLAQKNALYQNVLKSFDEKMLMTKTSLVNFKNFYEAIFNDFKAIINKLNNSDSSIKLIDYISVAEAFSGNLIETILETPTDFTFEKILKEITFKNATPKIKIKDSISYKNKIHGNNKLFNLIISYVIDLINTTYKVNNRILLHVSDEIDKSANINSKFKIHLTFRLEFLIDEVAENIELQLDRKNLNLHMFVLSEFLKVINGSISFIEVNNMIKLTLPI